MGRPKGSKNKSDLVEKVSGETKVGKEDLDRLPVDALEKLDDLVPDEVETDETPEEDKSPSDVSESSPDPVGVKKGKIFVGNHPITGEPVYR